MEVTTRFELVDEGFADPCLTTWPRHHIRSNCCCSIWSGRRGSNSLPPPWQGGALPDELRPHIGAFTLAPQGKTTRIGLEPTTPSVTGWCSNQLSYRAISGVIITTPLWSGRRGSNSLPPPWQGGALPDELRPHVRGTGVILVLLKGGASDRNRTNDTGIFSPLLYRLSYRGITGAFVPAPSRTLMNRGPRKCLRSKDLWGRGGNLAFITQALLARIADEQQDFRRSDPDRARTDDPQRDRLVL